MLSPGKKHVALLSVVLVLSFIGLGMGVQRSVLAYEDVDEYMRKLKVLTNVLITIQKYYVEPEKAETEKLVKGAIHGMVSSLDRYSVFLEEDEAKEFNDQTQGSFGGLGIQIKMVDGWLTVIEPLPDTPAKRAGLMSGDRIVEIEGKTMQGLSIEKAIKLLKGEPNTQVAISVARKGEKELMKITLTREIIHVSAVPESEQFMLDSTIGYVRLRDFTRDASGEVEAAIRKLQNQGMRGLVFDLRDNVGGLLDVAVSISDLFVEKGKIIVSHKDRNKYETVYYAEREPIGDFLLAVLVNEFSASASEIVAGCIQDQKRGVIVGPAGHKTFGKGSVQTLYELPTMPGASLKMTTAKYYTPSGRSIEDDKGLMPDLFAPVTDEQRRAIIQAGKVGVLLPAQVGKKLKENKSGLEAINEDIQEMEAEPVSDTDVKKTKEKEPESGAIIENATQPVKPVTVEEVFKEAKKNDADMLYDIELFTAYQCLKGAEVLTASGKK
jgi:carboxyl-terminal processing protease